MDLQLIDGDRLAELLPMEQAVEALEAAWRKGMPSAPQRQHLQAGTADLLLMPAWNEEGIAVKLVTVQPDNPRRGLPLIHGIYVLFDPETGQVTGLIDGSALTALRTAAVSGLATRHLARSNAKTLVVFGAGTQAAAHIDAMLAVRPIERVIIVSRTRAKAEGLANATAGRVETDVGSASAVSVADIICCCTTSSEPLFDGSELVAGTHINAVGAYKPTTRELDSATMARATVVVETRAAAQAEAGDVVIAIKDGVLQAEDLIELGEVLGGRRARSGDSDVTVFKSVGMAAEDLIVALAAMGRSG